MSDARRDVGLFRYALIREAADLSLSKAERGLLVRSLAARDHVRPDGTHVRVSRKTLDRWIRLLMAGGFDALVPSDRQIGARTPAVMLDLAVKLKKEQPKRTAAQVVAIMGVSQDCPVPSRRTVQRHFARLGLNTRPDGTPPEAFGRFEAAARNDRWTGDALHGPQIGGAKTYLFAFIDDHSRLLVGYRWGRAEDTVRLEAAFRHGLSSRGVPRSVYVDNGAAYVASPLLRTCAVLGVRLVHSTPRRPEGRGKIERFFRTVRDQFLVEIGLHPPDDLAGMNRLFTGWVETVYNQRTHTETGQTPMARFTNSGVPPAIPSPAAIHEAFLWSEKRRVTKTATVSLLGNIFEVDAVLVGQTVECVFDPFDLTSIEVRYQNRPMGQGIPQKIGRHTHPMARPEPPEPSDTPKTGIDYLTLIADIHQSDLNKLTPPTRYAGLVETTDPDQMPGQLQIPTTNTTNTTNTTDTTDTTNTTTDTTDDESDDS